MLPVLLETLRSDSSAWWVRAAAAAAIGSLGSGTTEAADALALALTEDEDIWVRRNAAESLGYVLALDAPTETAATVAAALVRALAELDVVEAFEYEHAEQYRETFRQAAATALARAVSHPVVAGAVGVQAALHAACTEGVGHKLNAVTRWSAVVALDRMGSLLLPDALEELGWGGTEVV